MGKESKTVGIYIRVSTNMQVEHGYSLEGQKKEGIQEAYKRYGNNVDLRFYVDEGISTESTIRKELNRMMLDIRKGNLDAVITYKLSRLSRNLPDSQSLVEEIHGSNVNFISVTEGEYSSYHTISQFNIPSALAQYLKKELV